MELARIRELTWLYLSPNKLSGCIPRGLRDTEHNDFAELGLPYCY